jgi:(p)ppGpp synthase/HD superfamily hydrolase
MEPYIVHPAEVVEILRTVDPTEEMMAAAWLHDTVEDTGVTLELIRAEFGDAVADLVGWLTDVSRPDHGNRAARKAVDRAHTASAPAAAQTIKCADMISNTRSIVAHDAKFAQTYLAEKRLLLAVMTRADPRLLARAREQIG